MKYAIIEISGRQFWVEEEKYYDLNQLPIKVNTIINLNKILLINFNNTVLIGKPYLENATISALVLRHLKSLKLIVYKMRPKKKTRKKQGHRQNLTRIQIKEINIL